MITQVKFFDSPHLSYLETTINKWLSTNALIENVSVSLETPRDKNGNFIATVTYNTYKKDGKIIIGNQNDEDDDDSTEYDFE